MGLPPYRVRRSSRAHHARLTYHPRTGLTVVVPLRYDARHVPELVVRHLDWVRRTEARLHPLRLDDWRRDGPFPELISLRALEEEWSVRYQHGPAGTLQSQPGGLLLVGGGDGPFEPVAQALGRWLARRAAETLRPQVVALAADLDERLERVTIRAQRSRWGSCSSRRTISLNRSLLFLPPELARLVLLHEVSHLRELSHSARFWAVLTELEPRARTLAADLRSAWRYVPAWAEGA